MRTMPKMKQCTNTWIISLCYTVYIYTTLHEATGVIGNGEWEQERGGGG